MKRTVCSSGHHSSIVYPKFPVIGVIGGQIYSPQLRFEVGVSGTIRKPGSADIVYEYILNDQTMGKSSPKWLQRWHPDFDFRPLLRY